MIDPTGSFRLSLQARDLSHHTVDNYVLYTGLFLRWCTAHEVDWRESDRNVLQTYLGQQAETHARTTLYLTRTVLKIFFEWAQGEGIVSKKKPNPAKQVEIRRAQARLTEPFSRDELRRMFDACQNYREQAVYLLLVGAGLRRSEVVGITRADISPESGSVAVMGKGRKRRYVKPGALAMNALIHALTFDEHLVPGGSDEYAWWTVKRLAKRAGVPGRVFPHRFRHTYSTTFLDEGGSIEELQVILGHSNISQSLFYAKANKERRALDRMGSIDIAGRLFTVDETRLLPAPGGSNEDEADEA